jgi:hypothetical protein
MNLYLPMALAFKFQDFTISNILVYSGAAIFFLLFTVYYKKKIHRDNVEMARRRNEYVLNHSGLSSDCQEAILSGGLVNGMSEADMIASIGHPRKVKILTVEPANSEVWIYRSGFYVHIHMGIVQKWKIHHKFISFS